MAQRALLQRIARMDDVMNKIFSFRLEEADDLRSQLLSALKVGVSPSAAAEPVRQSRRVSRALVLPSTAPLPWLQLQRTASDELLDLLPSPHQLEEEQRAHAQAEAERRFETRLRPLLVAQASSYSDAGAVVGAVGGRSGGGSSDARSKLEEILREVELISQSVRAAGGDASTFRHCALPKLQRALLDRIERLLEPQTREMVALFRHILSFSSEGGAEESEASETLRESEVVRYAIQLSETCRWRPAQLRQLRASASKHGLAHIAQAVDRLADDAQMPMPHKLMLLAYLESHEMQPAAATSVKRMRFIRPPSLTLQAAP